MVTNFMVKTANVVNSFTITTRSIRSLVSLVTNGQLS